MTSPIPESIGKRIARLRQEKGFTQQTLADRLAISRVAVSHIEAELTIPSERTITLLAGLFKCAPYTLVKGTTYPQAKAERLPYVVAWYTELELELEMLKKDIEWVQRVKDLNLAMGIVNEWESRLARWEGAYLDVYELQLLNQAWEKVRANFSQ